MKITFDTNVIVRLLVADDTVQLNAAKNLLARVDHIAVPLATLCECVWVMRRIYRIAATDIADRLTAFLSDARIRAPVEACTLGIALLREGGDFADAVIAIEGERLGGESLVTFDREAARMLRARGLAVTLLD